MRYSVVAIASIVTVSLIFAACSVLKKDDPEKEIRDFLHELDSKISGPDDLIMKYFNSQQSNQALLAAIHILQNKESNFIETEASFNQAMIYFEGSQIRVVVPATLRVKNLESQDETRGTSFGLLLAQEDGRFVIKRIEAEEMYKSFKLIDNQIAWKVNQMKALADRQQYYLKASQIQEDYDSAIWYTHYRGVTYYYVVDGVWRNSFLEDQSRNTGFTMGLVDENGQELIPTHFDLIGTPGFIAENIVEVKTNNHVGWYDLKGNKLVDASYTWIIPYSGDQAVALAQRDSAMGWFDESYSFHEGYPDNKAQNYVENFRYLPVLLEINADTYSMCEITSKSYAGYGILIPPAYLTANGLVQEIMGDFIIDDIENMAFTKNIGSKFEFERNVFDDIGAILSSFTSRYVGGREEFYTTRQIAFVDRNRKLLYKQRFEVGQLEYKKIDSTLLEVKVTPHDNDVEGYYEYDEDGRIPNYYYFHVSEQHIEPVKVNRRYASTAIVKLDSSYFTGTFIYYDDSGDELKTDFMPEKFIKEMRNEILATYGFIFPDPHDAKRFEYEKWYVKLHTSYEFLDEMSEIDRYNLTFLENMVGTLDTDKENM